MLKSKIHKAIVTDCSLNYEGSITIGKRLIKDANLNINEKVDIYNVTNGQRFTTYVIEGSDNGIEIIINGAAARLCEINDVVIIASYFYLNNDEILNYKPKIIHFKDYINN